MPVDYNPKDAVTVWPKGEYQAILKAVEDKTSKVKPDGSGGNPMQVWTWEVYAPDGNMQLISDYVVIPSATFKIKQLAKALGKSAEFDAGNFQADDYIGADIIAELDVEQQPGYDDKNKIRKYHPAMVPEPAPMPATRQQQQPSNPSSTGQRARQPIRGASQRPAKQEPFGEEKQFSEADIPFAWAGRVGQPL